MQIGIVLVLAVIITGCATNPRAAREHVALPDRFEIFNGGALGPSYTIRIASERLRCSKSPGLLFGHWSHDRYITPSAEQWAAFWSEVQAVDLWHWRHSYKVPPPDIVCDGTQWDIDISYGGKSVRSSGDNAYPSDSNPAKTEMVPTQRFQRLNAAVQQLVGRRNFE